MKINLYRVSYHTIRHDEEGREISRTSPETVMVAAKDMEQVFESLPKPSSADVKNVIVQTHVMYHDITFAGTVEHAPAAIRRQPEPEPQEKQEGLHSDSAVEHG